MKTLIYLLLPFLILSCQNKPKEKDYVTFSGEITNHNTEINTLSLYAYPNYKKSIKINIDGSFSDTLKIANRGIYSINHEKGQSRMFLRNGYDLHLSWDANKYDETIQFSGNGTESNLHFRKTYFTPTDFQKDTNRFKLSESDYKQKLEVSIAADMEGIPKSDTTYVSFQKEWRDNTRTFAMEDYEKEKYFTTVIGKGMYSPQFENYENYNGGVTSLKDLIGKYVFIDVWATWCRPCIAEIPFLEEIEKQYHGKNIVFISISVDKDADHDKWKDMIKEKEMGGIQLLADNSSESKFMRDYKVNGIPRFIIIDPEGKIVANDAPRPSEKEMMDLLKTLKF